MSSNEVQQLDLLPRHHATALYDQWRERWRSNKTALTYDAWLEIQSNWRADAAMAESMVLESNRFRFVLTHGWRYEILDRKGGVRMFDCLIHEDQVFVSLSVPGARRRGPWVCPMHLFRKTELRTMTPVTQSPEGALALPCRAGRERTASSREGHAEGGRKAGPVGQARCADRTVRSHTTNTHTFLSSFRVSPSYT